MSSVVETVLIGAALASAAAVVLGGAICSVRTWRRQHSLPQASLVAAAGIAAGGVTLLLPWMNGRPQSFSAPVDGLVSTIPVTGAGYAGQHAALASNMAITGAVLLLCAAAILVAWLTADRRRADAADIQSTDVGAVGSRRPEGEQK